MQFLNLIYLIKKMIGKNSRRISITLPKDLDDFLDLTVKELQKTDRSWTKSKLVERTLLIHIHLAEETADKDKQA